MEIIFIFINLKCSQITMLRVIICFLFFFIHILSVHGQKWLADRTQIIYDLNKIEHNELIKDLLGQCDGFKLSIAKNSLTNNDEIRFQNQNTGVENHFRDWFSFLKSNPGRIIVLFIEPEIPWEQVKLHLEKTGLMDLVVTKNADGSFPSSVMVVEAKKQIILFSLSDEQTLPNWVSNFWDYGLKLKPSLSVPTLINDIEKGDYRADLLMMDFYSESELYKDLQKRYVSSGWSGWQYVLNYLLDMWKQNGKKVTFFVTDPALEITSENAGLVDSFMVVSGKVQHNLLPLEYVIWGGEKQKFTHGNFSFPLSPNEIITLTPQSPGFEFLPSSIQVSGNGSHDPVYFFANPVDIKYKLQVYFPFTTNTTNNSKSGISGINHGIQFRNDIQRGPVATFGAKRWITLPPANQLGIKQADFTFAVWLKLDSANTEQSIIGTYTRDLGSSIHLSLRNNIPYFGFFGNDHLGKNPLETGRWYHVVWRYLKFSGEQAIYINGILDSRSKNHPAYDGTDSLYIGRTTLVGGRYFNGQMSDFVLWSRALGETEILLLAKDLAPIDESVPVSYWSWGAAFLMILLIVAVVFIFKRKTNRYIKRHKLETIAAMEMLEWEKVSLTLTPKKTAPVKSDGLVTQSELKPDESIITEASVIASPAKVQIQVFGKFKLIDISGMNRIIELSPKIRELLLVLLLFSNKYEEGISTEELTIVLWNGFDSKKATNNRNVSIHKLRMKLKELPGVELVFENNFWKMNQDYNLVHFDYPLCFGHLKKLSNPANHTQQILEAFYAVISKGKFLPEDQYPWLDAFKERVDTEIIEALNLIVEKNQENFSREELINWIDLLMLFDPINEDMIEMLMKVLTDNKLARHYYNKFSQEYKVYYGEKFSPSFSELFD